MVLLLLANSTFMAETGTHDNYSMKVSLGTEHLPDFGKRLWKLVLLRISEPSQFMIEESYWSNEESGQGYYRARRSNQ